MILGFLMTHLFLPEGGKETFEKFMYLIQNNSGFFGWEKTHYSFLTPQIAHLSRHIARLYSIPFSSMPDLFRQGFSTVEWQSLLVAPGYRTHLIALALWVEIELYERKFSGYSREVYDPWLERQKFWISDYSTDHLDLARIRFTAQRLVEIDSKNLFFRWLRLKVAGLLTPALSQKMLWELNSMPQFPKGNLPYNCDRKADYLWMRHSIEAKMSSLTCDVEFSGVDYLWITSLILGELQD